MNYLKIYCNLVRRAENRTPPEGYKERHHIFPVSIYGKNKRIAVLTAREHYIAHALLQKICIKRYGLRHRKTIKMIRAFWSMNNQRKKDRYVNSHLYENFRKIYIENVSGENHPMYGKKYSLEERKKISDRWKRERHPNYGRKASLETRKKLSEIHKGHPATLGFTGRKHTEETKQKMREKTSFKSFCVISPTGEIICDKNMKEFCRKNNLDSGHFSCVLNGKRKSHKGFRLYLGEDT
jgi:hypothetical protein